MRMKKVGNTLEVLISMPPSLRRSQTRRPLLGNAKTLSPPSRKRHCQGLCKFVAITATTKINEKLIED